MRGPIVALTLLACNSATHAESVRVMSFNIRYINSNDTGQKAWDARKDHVANLIKADKPDLVGLQEALRPMLDDLHELIPGYTEIGVGRADGALQGEYCAVWVKSDRFTIQDSGTFWLSATPEIPNTRTWGNQVVRICTWTRLWDRKSRQFFDFYNTHLDHESQMAREKGMALIASHIEARRLPGPFILTGDLNGTESDPLHLIARRNPNPWTDAWRSVHPDVTLSLSGTVHGFNGNRDGNRIDYIYVSEHFRVLDANVLNQTSGGDIWPSDHFPVRATLELSAANR